MAGSRRERLSSCCERKPSRSTFCPPRAGSPFERFQRLAAPFPSHCNCPAGCRSLGEPREDLILRSRQSWRLEGDPEPTDSTNVRGVSWSVLRGPLRGASGRGGWELLVIATNRPAATRDLATAVLAPVEPFQGLGRQNLSQTAIRHKQPFHVLKAAAADARRRSEDEPGS